MNKQFIDICDDFGIDPNMPFNKIMEGIYYDWDQEVLQDFMDALLAAETDIGEALFDN